MQQLSLGAKAAMMGCGQSTDRNALREVSFHPSSEFWGGLGVKCHAFLESRLGGK